MSTYNIDQSKINWIRDGDPQDQETFNRPTDSLREEINKELQKFEENISLSLPSSVQDSSKIRVPSEKQVVQQLLNLEAQGGEVDLTGAVTTTGNQSVGGIKTFSSLPRIPTSTPSRNDEVQSKNYVDSRSGGKSIKDTQDSVQQEWKCGDSGLIMKFGKYFFNGRSSAGQKLTTINFNKQFPNAVLNIQFSMEHKDYGYSDSDMQRHTFWCRNLSNKKFDLWWDDTGVGKNTSEGYYCNWFAIGY